MSLGTEGLFGFIFLIRHNRWDAGQLLAGVPESKVTSMTRTPRGRKLRPYYYRSEKITRRLILLEIE